jgi:hypothetical protein
VAPTPWALAMSWVPSTGVKATVLVPCCTSVTPSFEMLMFCPGAFGLPGDDDEAEDVPESDALFCPGAAPDLPGDDDEAEDEDEPESVGLADAIQGVEASPTPMPRATASAPTRPMYFVFPMMVSISLVGDGSSSVDRGQSIIAPSAAVDFTQREEVTG